MGDIQAATMGGAFFSTLTGPNGVTSINGTVTYVPDQVLVCPSDVGDGDYPGNYQGVTPTTPMCTSTGVTDANAFAAARSRHSGGIVIVAFADGHTTNLNDSIERGFGRCGHHQQFLDASRIRDRRGRAAGAFGPVIPRLRGC